MEAGHGKVEENAHVWARVLARRDQLRPLRWVFGAKLRIGPAATDERVEVEVGGPDHATLVRKLMMFGASVEALGPETIRAELGRIARELVALYSDEALPAVLAD